MDYGKILKEIRLNKGLTQDKIANILGISSVTYSHYEIQEKIIPTERLNDICNYFNISIDYALSLNDKSNYENSSNGINNILVGKRLKEFRKENKLTQVKLAKVLNTVQPTVVNYENGKNLITLAFLYTICSKYHISADYLLGKVDSPKYLK